METEKLYYTDPFLTTFTAKVLSCEAGKGGYLVTLDRTAFYPEGGGQPADHGTLGGIAVTDVHEKDGVVIHTVEKAVEIGENVTGSIDWARRFDHMQQHSGEHICSGLICERFHCDNVGFHMGADVVTIDFNADISWDELMEIEQLANLYIYEDHPIDIQFYRGAELDKVEYRSKKPLEGDVRIVSFPGADCCACCGTHVRRAGEVGIIKVLSCQKFREGVRLEILCGSRAYRYLSQVYDQDRAVAQLLSVKPQDTLAAAERRAEELAAAKAEAADWQDKYVRLHAEWDTYRRRMTEQREAEKVRATEKLMESLIPVLDDFARTVDYAETNGETGLLGGVKAVQAKLSDTLAKGGLVVISPAGEAFDALECQAVGTVDDPSVPDETVAQVYQPGYKMGTKVIRPAMVTITTGGPKREKPEEE